MIAYYIAHYAYIAYAYILKLFFTLTINSNNYFYCNIIIYNLEFFIDI